VSGRTLGEPGRGAEPDKGRGSAAPGVPCSTGHAGRPAPALSLTDGPSECVQSGEDGVENGVQRIQCGGTHVPGWAAPGPAGDGFTDLSRRQRACRLCRSGAVRAMVDRSTMPAAPGRGHRSTSAGLNTGSVELELAITRDHDGSRLWSRWHTDFCRQSACLHRRLLCRLGQEAGIIRRSRDRRPCG